MLLACGFVWGCKTLDISNLLGWLSFVLDMLMEHPVIIKRTVEAFGDRGRVQ